MDLRKTGGIKFGLNLAVLPDAHRRPEEGPDDVDRFYAFSKFVLDTKPDVVVVLGDLGDFDGLNPYKPKSAAAFDGKAVKRDADCFKETLKIIQSAVNNANKRHIRNRRRDRIWEPVWIFLEGNHEERWRRIPETELLGHDYLKNIAEELNWNWHRFLKPVEIGGVLFAHYFTTGVSRRPAGVRQILNKTHRSCVYGHTHSFGYDQAPVLGGGTISALCAGCFKPPHRTGEHEWSGIITLTDVQDGSFSIQQHPYDHILEQYGEGGYAKTLQAARRNAAQDSRDADHAFA